MIILGINRSHNSSIALLEDNKIVLHIESERITKSKYEPIVFSAIQEIKKYTKKVDYLAIAGFDKVKSIDNERLLDAYTMSVLGLGKTFKDNGIVTHDFSSRHHDMHASCAFYNSGFDKAVIIVKDGAGSAIDLAPYGYSGYGREISSSYIMEYPNEIKIIEKMVNVPFSILEKTKIHENVYISNSSSEGWLFEKISKSFGFSSLDAGKVMGMSSYGKKIENLDFYNDNIIYFKENNNGFYNLNINLDIPEDFNERANIAKTLQCQTEKKVIDEILSIISTTKEKNICLTGGLFLNCVMNYKIRKALPKDINLYIEPISSDAGTSIGAAKYLYYTKINSNEIVKQKNIYYGISHDNEKIEYRNKMNNIDSKYVAKLISEKNIVAIYQGGSESGPRALGNRSIIYDPRDPNGKDKVNVVKNREWFRPFAGSILEEEVHNWFDIDCLNDSPFMMYAVNVLESKKSIIPSIVHVDGTCRIQTVNKDQNELYYSLIEEFYKITGVPILFNTSFNLAGDCMVESIDDAIHTFEKSKIDFLYFPKQKSLLYKE